MALELGGRADKFGNEYERLWIIRQALRMLEGEAVSVHWEPLGDEGEGIEFRLRLLDDTTEGHQCKSENGTAGKWTVASLKKVLPKAKLQLTNGHVDRFVFVSRDAVPIVRELARRSRHCNDDPAKFLKHSVPSTHREEFVRACELWGLDSSDEGQLAEVLRLLQRLRFRVWDEERESVERAASRLANGGARAIVACIGDFLFANIGNEVHVDQLRQHLREAGHPPWDLRPGEIAPAIERLQTEFEDSVGGALIGESLIPRPETTQLRTLLADSDGPRTVFLHGDSGSGKSGVLLELMRVLGEEGTVVLPVRLDIHRPESTLEAFSDDLRLPAPPSDCLAALAAGRPAVLILDQLDAIRWTGGHAAKAWAICKEIIERALDFHDVRIVVACRTFDLDDDQQIKAWERKARESALHRLERVEAKKLGDEVVKEVVESHGGVYESMSARERKLLTNPQCLYVWCAIRQWEEEPQAYDTQTDLLSEFLGRVRRRVTDDMGVQTTDYDALLDSLVDYLDRNSRLEAPRGHVAQYQKALDGLRSIGIVQQVGTRLRFTHQSYFDHLVAARVLSAASRDDQAPAEWLRSGGQSLLQRQQLRQLLLLLRDREPERYVSTLRALLTDGEVRFHLKHLTLNHLRAITEPNEQERSLVLEWLSSDEWRTYVLEESVARNAAWFDVVDDQGLVTSWLSSGQEPLVEKAQWLCRVFAEERPERVEAHLRAAWSTGDEQSRRFVDWAMPYRVEKQTEAMFGWRLERIRAGDHPLEFHQVELVAKTDGGRAIRMLEAFLDHAVKLSEAKAPTPRRRRIDLEGERFEPLELACREHGATAWSFLSPVLDRALKLREQLDEQIENGETEEDQYPRREELRPILSLLEKTLAQAGASLASTDPSGAIARIEALGPKDAPPAYFSALLRGLSETGAPKESPGWQPATVEDIEGVFGYLNPISDVEVARAVCWVVRGRPSEGWSDETRSLIRDLAKTVVEPSVVMVATGTEPAQEDLDSTSLSCLQGAVAHAIAALTYANQDLVPEFLPTVENMVRDPRAAVRLAALVAVGPVYNHSRDESAALFMEACNHDDDRILASRVTWNLLRYLREPYAKDIVPILERMASSPLPATAEAGAFWATIQKHTLDRERELADRCASGTPPQRKGVVEALGALCESEEWRACAHNPLSAFFNDDDDQVLSKATNVFRSKKVLADTTTGPELALAFSNSSGFQKSPSGMIDWLERWEGSLVPYAEAILRTVDRLSGEIAENTRDVSRRDGMVGQDTTTVLLRLYGEADDGGSRGLRDRCLDALDALLKGRVGFVKDKLEKLDAE